MTLYVKFHFEIVKYDPEIKKKKVEICKNMR